MEPAFNVTLAEVETVSDSTRWFRFVRDDGQPVVLEPGQFFRFTFSDGKGDFERSYSLANERLTGSPDLDLVVSRVDGGRATDVLFSASEGLTASVRGPYGRLVIPDPLPERLIMVSTSVGIAPFVPMLPVLDELPVNVEFVFGVRDRSEFLYRDALLSRHAHDGFNLSLCLSREVADPAQDYEHDGYVTPRVAALDPNPETDQLLLWGNPMMIDDVWGDLKGRGFRPKRVTREKYVFARDTKTEVKGPTADQKKLIEEKLKALRGE